MNDLLEKVKKLHEQGWIVELKWEYFNSKPYFIVDIMDKDIKRCWETSSISIEDAFNKVYNRLMQNNC